MHVHQKEIHSKLIKSSHSLNDEIYYRIYYGDVDWGDNQSQRAYVFFMQYGNTANWELAKSNGEIKFRENVHILESDFPRVLQALNELAKK